VRLSEVEEGWVGLIIVGLGWVMLGKTFKVKKVKRLGC
jgi:hypothetical protein